MNEKSDLLMTSPVLQEIHHRKNLIDPDPQRHSCECMCTYCAEAGTGYFGWWAPENLPSYLAQYRNRS